MILSDPFVKVIAHSISPEGVPIITAHFRYWRAIHAEIMTHRVFSRNARSSRAVPTEKMIAEIINDPFIPRHWGKNQKGMQAGEEHNAFVTIEDTEYYQLPEGFYWATNREQAWLWARDQAVTAAQGFSDAGYHKQIVNRLVEPYMWIDTLITSTDWANFFALRDHKDAEPHFKDLAQMAKESFANSTPDIKGYGMWHAPYITTEDITNVINQYGSADADDILLKISAARCARISYVPFDGNPSIEKELERAKLLVSDTVHASPFEHQATPAKMWEMEHHKCRNFHGWIQHRSLIPNETTWDKYSK